MNTRLPDQPNPTSPIGEQINTFFDHIIMCVNARRITLLAIAEEIKNAKIERLRRRIEGEEQLVVTKGEIERVMKENILLETQDNLLREVERKLEEVRTPLPETHVVFRGEYGHLEELISTLGEIREEQEVRAASRYEEMRPIVAVGKRGKAPGELWSPRAVTIDKNTNYIYVAAGNIFDKFPLISIFSDGGEFLNSYTHEHMKCPEGIAIHTNNMYITDTGIHTVFQFKIELDIRFVAKLGTEGSANGEFNKPTNLTVSTNGEVYVADLNNNRVQILDSSLHYLRTLTKQSIQRPLDIKLTADSVYLLCGVSPCIRVFSYTGDMLRYLITLGHQLQVKDACYFCLDPQENIFISDIGAHNIKAFTKEGTLIRSIGGRGHQIGTFLYPKGLTLNNELKLVVLSHNESYRLQIFSL